MRSQDPRLPLRAPQAEFLLSRAKYISPNKYYPRYLLAQYYSNIGEYQKVLEEAEDLLCIEP